MGGGQGDEGDDARLQAKSSSGGAPVLRDQRHATGDTGTCTVGGLVTSLRTLAKHNNRKLL